MSKKILLIILCITFNNYLVAERVIRVIDGDTFEIEGGEKVRMIGINAPELSDVFGQDSRKYLFELIQNKNVILEDDLFSNKTDKYNRLLKYVYLNGVDINKKMILDGYATAYLKFKFEKNLEYKTSQINAKRLAVGMWENVPNSTTSSSTFEKGIPSFKNSIIIISLLLLVIIGIISYNQK